MPVRRGHVALQNTYLDTIIRKFDEQSECSLLDLTFGRHHRAAEISRALKQSGFDAFFVAL